MAATVENPVSIFFAVVLSVKFVSSLFLLFLLYFSCSVVMWPVVSPGSLLFFFFGILEISAFTYEHVNCGIQFALVALLALVVVFPQSFVVVHVADRCNRVVCWEETPSTLRCMFLTPNSRYRLSLLVYFLQHEKHT